MVEKTWWTLDVEEVSAALTTNPDKGLSASEVKKRYQFFGHNILPTKKRISAFAIFLRQFSSLIIWILLGALVISGLLQEWIDAISIGLIVLLNTLIGFLQEYGAEVSLESLKKLVRPTAKVIRDATVQIIPSKDLVPGDVIILEAGDKVSADGRVIEAISLATQEASLTGESVPVFKKVEKLEQIKLPIGDRSNMLFMGTIVVNGKGTMVVTETGRKTELGKIASFLKEEPEEKTPLQIKFENLGKRLLIICALIIVLVILLGFVRNYDFLSIVLISMSLAVAAIPEGLPAVMTTALAVGVKKMVKRNALIRRLSSVETLGSTTVICTDKTGTLTQNEMVVTSIWVNNMFVELTGVGYEPQGEFRTNETVVDPASMKELMVLLEIGTLCSNAAIDLIDNKWQAIGDPTEAALITAAGKADITKKKLNENYRRIHEIPFDYTRKKMSVVVEINGKKLVYVKGAPDIILESSKAILMQKKPIPLTEEIKLSIIKAYNQLANKALRGLAFAYKEINNNESFTESLEKDLVFVGIVGMIDLPRQEAKVAINKCKEAGIKVVMITGDYKETAIAIAKELGIFKEGSQALSGQELDSLNDNQLKEMIELITVFARVSAEHKIRIVKAWKSLGNIIAMTGDGVNDAPAIKAADIGIAMGITGTEITKEAADMIILDDNFATIVNAVEEGRGIFDNITKFVHYMISANFAELLVIFLGLIIGFKDAQGNPYISLLPVQILWINLVTDGLPAIALAFDPTSPQIMKQKPRLATAQLLPFSTGLYLLLIGFIIAFGSLYACHYGLTKGQSIGHTMAFTTMVFLEFARLHLIRSQYKVKFLSNYLLILGLGASFVLQLMIIYIPIFQTIFKTTALGIDEWIVIGIILLVIFAISSIINIVMKKYFTHFF